MAADRSLAARETADIAWLTSDESRALLASALEPEGMTLRSSRVHEVHHRPGAGVTVGYDVRVTSPGGHEHTEYLLATTASLGSAESETAPIVRIDTGERVVHVWRHPMDPLLPGLGVATDINQVDLRVRGHGDDTQPDLELIAYRPLRRAVLAFSRGSDRVFLKVVRPDQVKGLLARNRCAEPAGSPAVLDVWPESVLVFAQAEGEPLPEALARNGAAGVDPKEFIRCLDRLDPSGVELRRRVSWARRTGHYEKAAQNVLPDQADRIATLAEAIREVLERVPDSPQVVTHGDFHAANIFMAQDRIVSLLDVDTLGPGQRVEDLACLIGHLSVLPSLAPQSYPNVPGTILRWLAEFDRHVDPVGLRVHASGVVLSLLASMPSAVTASERLDALARLAMAEEFLESALVLEA